MNSCPGIWSTEVRGWGVFMFDGPSPSKCFFGCFPHPNNEWYLPVSVGSSVGGRSGGHTRAGYSQGKADQSFHYIYMICRTWQGCYCHVIGPSWGLLKGPNPGLYLLAPQGALSPDPVREKRERKERERDQTLPVVKVWYLCLSLYIFLLSPHSSEAESVYHNVCGLSVATLFSTLSKVSPIQLPQVNWSQTLTTTVLRQSPIQVLTQ